MATPREIATILRCAGYRLVGDDGDLLFARARDWLGVRIRREKDGSISKTTAAMAVEWVSHEFHVRVDTTPCMGSEPGCWPRGGSQQHCDAAERSVEPMAISKNNDTLATNEEFNKGVDRGAAGKSSESLLDDLNPFRSDEKREERAEGHRAGSIIRKSKE